MPPSDVLPDIFRRGESFKTSAFESNFLYGAGQLLIPNETLKWARSRDPMDIMLVRLLATDFKLCEKISDLLKFCAPHLFQAVYATALSSGMSVFMQEQACDGHASKRKTVSEHALDSLKRLANHDRVPVDPCERAMSVTLALQVLGGSIRNYFCHDGIRYCPDNDDDPVQTTLIKMCEFARQFPDLSDDEVAFCMVIVRQASSVLLSEYELTTGG